MKSMCAMTKRWAMMAGLAGVLAGGSACTTVVEQAPLSPNPVVSVHSPQTAVAHQALRVRFKTVAPDSAMVAKVLSSRVEGTLADAGYTVVHSGRADIEAVADVRTQERNKRGSRVAWMADADMKVINAAYPNEVVSRSWMDVQSGAARSAEEAQKQLAGRLAEEIIPFTKTAVRRAAKDLRLVEVTVKYAWAPYLAESYPDIFMKTVGKMSGVYSCRVLSMDAAKGMRAEVLYDERSFPEGFLNQLKTRRELGLVVPLE